MKTKRTLSLSQKGKVLAFCLGEKTKALMPTSFLARAAMMLLVMVLTTTTSIAMTSIVDWSGDGSADHPYIISNTDQLDVLAQRVNAGTTYESKYFKLGDDIAYDKNTENNFTPIGDNSHIFCGTFDGDGKTISGININSGDANYQGVFGFVDGTVKNLVVSNCSIVGRRMTGAIAGTLRSGTIENCHVDNVTLSGNICVGGIVGSCERGTIKGCTCAATITGTVYSGNKANNLGGIVGATYEYASTSPKLTDNIFTGTISGDLDYNIGAIVGENASGTLLTNNVYTSTGFGGIGASASTTGADGDGAKRAYTIAAGEKLTVDFAGDATTTYSPNGISVYGAGMKYANTLYVDGTAAVSVKLSSDDPVNSYSASAGTLTGTAITGSEDAYTLAMATPASDITITADFALWGEKDGADGSAEKPYIITTTAGLDLLAQRVNAGDGSEASGFSGKFFKLGDNIAYDKNTANNFTPIGDNDHIFCGTFDGDGKTISGININSGSANYQAIFGFVDGVNGTVKNLVVSNCSIGGRHSTGVIAGKLRSGTIENCRVENNVALSGKMYVGGIVGVSERGITKGCTSAATITGIEYSGNNAKYLGGIVGATYEYNSTSSKLTDNIFTGTINGDLGEYIGAIVGEKASGDLTNNHYTSTGFGGIGAKSSTTGADGAGARQALTISATSGVTITPKGAATTYDVSGITVYADNSGMGYDSKLYAGATNAVKLTLDYSGTPSEGYTFAGYAASDGGTISGNATDGYTLTMPAANVTVTPTLTPIEYTLQYNGADGATFATANPTTYTVESDAITLTNPTKDGYTFAGWTGTGLTEATTTVTIAKGSTGNREYTATWKKLLTNTDIKVSAIANQTYTGSALTPAVTVKDGTTDITALCDITYSNSKVVGTATVTITAKATSAAYTGKTTATFKIVAKTVSSPTIMLSETSFVYDGTAKTPTVTVKDGETVIPASEYTVSYEKNTNVGTATVKITDVDGGNYTVSGTTTFGINAADGSLTAPTAKTGLVYSGGKQDLITAGSSTTGTMQYSLDGTNYGTTIPQGDAAKDYTIYYRVKGDANHSDIAPRSFTVTIASKTVSSPTITLSQTFYFFDGTAKKPTVTVKVGNTVIPASEYNVSYENNTNIGTATVKITDRAGGNYTVSGSASFAIGMRGDANGDQKVDVADLVEMISAKGGNPSSRLVMGNADTDGDGHITDADIQTVEDIIMGR